jgi:Na+-transporting methylmalonyl-CoA/oxaloacetate decarboxylase gamma subunit
MPALPLDEAGKYVAAAYLVFLTLLIVYVAIMGMKVTRMEREIAEILEEAERSEAVKPSQDGEQPPQTARQDASPEVTSP